MKKYFSIKIEVNQFNLMPSIAKGCIHVTIETQSERKYDVIVKLS